MNKIRIIDLLNKIANCEEVPREFTYKGYLWEYDVKNKMWFYYFGESKSHRFDRLFYLNMILNDEVEIIEEEKKIPEKLDYCEGNTFMEQKETTYLSPKERRLLDSNFKELGNKINSIIDYLKSKGE